MRPRSLLTPPGIPESNSRERRLEPGPVTVRGRAWSGLAEIARVEVSADGGAQLERGAARAGRLAVGVAGVGVGVGRAAGHARALLPRHGRHGRDPAARATWNLGGYVNNEVQRVPVIVGRSQLDV